MKKILCLVMVLSITVSAFSIDIISTPPTSTDPTTNDALGTLFGTLENALNDQIGGIEVKPTNLIKAFGNSSVYASHGATQRGYSGYKTFAVTLGPSFGFQLPVSPFELASALDDFDKILEEGDLQLGLNPQLINAQIGINSSFLMKDLYLGFRIGFTPDLGDLLSNEDGLSLDFRNFLIGFTGNYQLIPSVSIVGGLLAWRGINLGTGLLIQNTSLKITYPLDQMNEGDANLMLTIDPSLYLDMKITTVTIPLEVTTAVNILFINIPLGVGMDIAFGKSDLKFGGNMDISFSGTLADTNPITPGNFKVEAGGAVAPTFANLKLMTGIGFKFGPVLLDIPVTFYVNNGLSLGVSLGVVF